MRLALAAAVALLAGCSLGTPYVRDLVGGEQVAGVEPFRFLYDDEVEEKLERSLDKKAVAEGYLNRVTHYMVAKGFAEGEFVELEWYSDISEFWLVVGRPRFPPDATDEASQARFLKLQVGEFAGVLSAPGAIDPGPVRLYATSVPGIFVTKRGDLIERVIRRDKVLATRVPEIGVCWTETKCPDQHSVLVTEPELLRAQLAARLAADIPRARAWARQAELDRIPEYGALLNQQREEAARQLVATRQSIQGKWPKAATLERLALLLDLDKAIRVHRNSDGVLDEDSRRDALRWRAELADGLHADALAASKQGRHATAARLAGLSAKLRGQASPPARTLAEALVADPSDSWALAQASLARAAISVVPIPAPGPSGALADAAQSLLNVNTGQLKAWGLSPGSPGSLTSAPGARVIRLSLTEPTSSLRSTERRGTGISWYDVPIQVPNPAYATWNSRMDELRSELRDAEAAYNAELVRPAPPLNCWTTSYKQENREMDMGTHRESYTVAVVDKPGGCNDPQAAKQARVDGAAQAYNEVLERAQSHAGREPSRTVTSSERREWRYTREEQHWSGEVSREVRLEGSGYSRALPQRESGENLIFLEHPSDPEHNVVSAAEFKREADVRASLVGTMNAKVGSVIGREWDALIAQALKERAAAAGAKADEEGLLQRLLFGTGPEAPRPDPLSYAPEDLAK